MAVCMTKESRDFLTEHLPNNVDDPVSVILDNLYDLIDEKGFAPPKYHEYNDFGRQAQKVYDDIYWNNLPE